MQQAAQPPVQTITPATATRRAKATANQPKTTTPDTATLRERRTEMNQSLNIWSLMPVLPLLAGCVWALFVLVVEMFSSNRRFTGVAWLSIVGLVGIAALALQPGAATVYADALANDSYTAFFTVLTCAIAVGSVLLSIDYEGRDKKVIGEINMGSSVYSTPVPANGALFISNRNQLFALSEAAAGKPATAKN